MTEQKETQTKQDEKRISKALFQKATTSRYRFESERYEFRDIIGRGGMGVVLNARDKLLNRDVAVKFLKPELNEIEEARDIFLSEARSMAVLSHANLISVFDVGVVEDHVMMVVELVNGVDLYRHIHRSDPPTPLSYEEVLRVGIQLCRVVHYMHTQGMIHRDLKPANIILQRDGSIKLIDFGLTRALDDIAIRQTQIQGTPAYMSPEQQDGHELTIASDIYQIGVTLFELLTTELPFKHHLKSSERQVLSPSEFDASIPEDICRCLIKAMQDDPAKRHQSAITLMEELQQSYARLSQPLLSNSQLMSESAHSMDELVVQTPDPKDEDVVAAPVAPASYSSKKIGALFVIALLVLGVGVGLVLSSQLNRTSLSQVNNELVAKSPPTPQQRLSPSESQPPANQQEEIKSPVKITKPEITKPRITTSEVAPTPSTVSPRTPKVAPDTAQKAQAVAPTAEKARPKVSRVKRQRRTRAAKPRTVERPPVEASQPKAKKKDVLVPRTNEPSLFKKKKKSVESGKKPSLFTP